MTNYNLEEFKAWLEANSAEKSQHNDWESVCKDLDFYGVEYMTHNRPSPPWSIVNKWAREVREKEGRDNRLQSETHELEQQIQTQQTKITSLETQLTTKTQELNIAQTALNTSQNNLAQKTNELTQAQELISKLQQDNRDLLNDIHQHQQKITTHEQTITQLKNTEKSQRENLAKFQEKWDNQLTQEKSFLQREIQLIKEVLHD